MNVNPFSKIQMVDDKANRFLPPSNMSWIPNANLNDDKYKESGLYCIGSASSNSPGNWGLLTVLKPRNDAIMQYYAVNNVMYHRDYTGGSWQSWKTFADTSDLGGVSHELKKSNGSGVLTYQLSLNTIHVIELSNATYHVLVSGGFAYHSDKKIGGDTLTLSYDEGTGILTISGARASTNAYIAKWSI